MAPRCRPPYEAQNARISILVNGIAERPDTFVQTVLSQLQKPLADGAGHTFPPCRRAVSLDVRGVDHLRGSGSPAPSKLPEKVFPDAAPRPAHKAVIDRCRRTVFGRAIAPAAAAFEHMHDAADHTAIVHSFNASDIRRQVEFNPRPLFIAQPKQVPAHDPDPPSNSNQDRIVSAQN